VANTAETACGSSNGESPRAHAQDRRYLVRAAVPSDRALYEACLSDADWRRKYGLFVAEQDIEPYVNSIALAEYRDVIRCIIEAGGSALAFFHIDFRDRRAGRCVISGGLKPALRRKGLGFSLASIAVDYTFRSVRVNKVVCKIYSFNVDSIRLARALGFSCEGISREHGLDLDGRCYVDALFFSMLSSEFPSPLIRRALARCGYATR
jgi:RimJ/RimL family protein N-acetyltransferase